MVNLGGYPLYTKGEAREAVTVFDIVNGGGVILPMRAGVEIPSKPLLMHWLAALVSCAAGGVNEWTVRLPSAVLAMAAMLLCYLYIRRLFEQRAALMAALMLGTSIQYLQAGGGSRVDMTLTFFMAIAFFEFIAIADGLSERTTLFYLALALAVLTKGPVGVVLPAMAAAVWITLWRRWVVIPRLKLARGALIVGVIGGAWYIAAIAAGGMDFVHKQILAENLYRLVHHHGFHEGHSHPFYYMEAALAAGFMPWTPVALVTAFRYSRAHKIDARFGYLIVWAGTVLLFYNLPQSKRGVYLLALYPALSAMVAILICDAIDRGEATARWVGAVARAAGGAFTLAGLAGLSGLILLYVWPASIARMLMPVGILVTAMPAALRSAAADHAVISILIPLLTGAIGVYLMISRPRAETMVGGIAAGLVSITLAVNIVVQPALANTLSLRDFARQTVKIAGTQPLGYFGSLDYDFAFYSGRNVILASPRDLNPPALMVTPEDGWKLVAPALANRYTILLRSNPTDLDNTGRMLLLRRIEPQTRQSMDDTRAQCYGLCLTAEPLLNEMEILDGRHARRNP